MFVIGLFIGAIVGFFTAALCAMAAEDDDESENKIKDYLHKVSTAIVKYMETNDLNTLFVGKNDGWKDSIN